MNESRHDCVPYEKLTDIVSTSHNNVQVCLSLYIISRLTLCKIKNAVDIFHKNFP